MAMSSGAGGSSGNDDHSRDENIRDHARSMAADAADGAHNVADEVREQMREGVAYARDEAERQARQGVHYGADQVVRTAKALRSAAQELEGSFQGDILHHAADGLQGISDDLRDKSIGEIVGDLAAYARRNPVPYLGAAALLGFAVARFARASSEHERTHGHGHHGRRSGHAGHHHPDDGKDRYGRDRFHRSEQPMRPDIDRAEASARTLRAEGLVESSSVAAHGQFSDEATSVASHETSGLHGTGAGQIGDYPGSSTGPALGSGNVEREKSDG